MQWEYMVDFCADASGTPLEDLGKEGWELVMVIQNRMGMEKFYFKRPINEQSE